MSKDILMVVDAVSNEKGVEESIIFEALEAALASATRKRHGGDIEVPSIDGGRSRVKIPAGSQSGRQMRLRGKGMPALRGGGTGDMFIELAVETPVNLTARQIELLKEFEELSEDNNPESSSFFSSVKSFWDSMKS